MDATSDPSEDNAESSIGPPAPRKPTPHQVIQRPAEQEPTKPRPATRQPASRTPTDATPNPNEKKVVKPPAEPTKQEVIQPPAEQQQPTKVPSAIPQPVSPTPTEAKSSNPIEVKLFPPAPEPTTWWKKWIWVPIVAVVGPAVGYFFTQTDVGKKFGNTIAQKVEYVLFGEKIVNQALVVAEKELTDRLDAAKRSWDQHKFEKAWSLLNGSDSETELGKESLVELLTKLQTLEHDWKGVDLEKLKSHAKSEAKQDLDEVLKLLEQAFPH